MRWIVVSVAMVMVMLAAGCTHFPTTRLGGRTVTVGSSSFRPVVVQYNHSDFFVTKSAVYAPVTRDLKVVKVVLKSPDIRGDQVYDFSQVQLKIGNELRCPRFVRFFPGDNPYGFLYGGGDKPSAVSFWGDGRFTVVLGYVARESERPASVVLPGQEVVLPPGQEPRPDVSDGVDDPS